MYMFKNCFSENVDLDDEKTYKMESWKDFSVELLIKEAYRRIGYCYMYFNFYHTDWDKQQTKRVDRFCFWFAEEWRNHIECTFENRLWFKKWLYRFDDETENMC